ncbi:unnamed protein product [Orchesella dallaii]|uniref:DUF243 domain-containing protein n=1 Tax=Orchesella dallaii TaxID=48710 RepID=A0ABP1RFU2_9HEXA
MKVLMVFFALVAAAYAQYQAYGAPIQPQAPIGPGPQQQEHVSQTFKHVYVHVAPDEPEDRQARTIRVPGGDKHVNIIFVKTPSSSSSQQTEVVLPEQDEHKNLVYVLLKKGEASSDIKIRRPQAQRPQKPEVYFIRYKGQEQQQQQQNGGYQQAAPAPIPQIVRQPTPTYGAPF